MLMFQLGCCVQQVTYISFFLLIAVLTKRTAIVNLAGIVIWFAEAALTLSASWYRGPVASMECVEYYVSAFDSVFCFGFLKCALSAAVIISVAGIAGYICMIHSDIV